MRRLLPPLRLRVIVLSAVMVSTMVGLEAAPLPAPADGRASAPLPLGLGPDPVLAAYCASNPTLTGRLTASASSTTAVSRITNANVYGYISNVNSAWSCTLYRRYSAIAWNTTATTGRFNWGTLINSTSVACNWAVGSTDYLKANDTADCPDTDAEYAMQVTLTAERVYQADVNHNGVGDFSFAHADCDTTPYYGDEIGKGTEASPVSFSTSASYTANRPGSNCDPITLDGTGTTQTVTYDKTAPVTNITAPTAAVKQAATSYTVQWQATDNVAKFGGTNDWDLQRQIATASGGSCGTFTNDTAAGNLVSGTSETAQSQSQTGLVHAKCYRWTLAATDQNGNAATLDTSPAVLIDTTAPVPDFATPDEGSTVTNGTTTYNVAWTESDPESAVTGRSLQRQRATLTGSTCGTFSNDGSAVTTVSPVSATLADGYCYRWVQTLTNGAGTTGASTSGTVKNVVGSPSVDFTTPNEGSTTIQATTSYTVAWTETAGSGTINSRSLQRQKGTIVTPNTCAGVTWANDGTASTAVSPVAVTGLLDGTCYRWTQTLTNSNGKSSTGTSGSVLVDTTAPAGSIVTPAANAPLAGDVTITGSATDTGTFLNYQLEYGAGTTPSAWTTIGTFTTQVAADNPLAMWSTGNLNGVHSLRLTVRDTAGNPAYQTTRLVYLENAERGTETYQTRVPFDLGGGWALDVGVSNGEGRLSRELFRIPSYGPPQSLGLTYSSLEIGAAGKFGVGWTSNLTQYLSFESGFVVWHRPDGGRVPFGNIGGAWTPLRGHFEVLGPGTGTYSVTLKDQTKLIFENSGAGRLTKIEDRFGNALNVVWGASSATATDASGRATTLTIDAVNSRITAATDSAGRSWGFGYTGTDLTSVTDPAGKVTTIGYNASHQLTTVIRSRSRVSGPPETISWTVGYASGKATSVTDPIDGAAASPNRNRFTYDAGSTTAELLQSYGAGPVWNASTYLIDSLGRVTSMTDPEGFQTSWVYDADSNATSVTTPIDDTTSATTTSAFDTRGNLVSESVPLDASTSVTTVNSWSATNDILTKSEADNDGSLKLVTKYSYDAEGHLTSVNVNCTTSGTTPPAVAASCTGAGTQDSATNLITSYAYTANDQLAYEQDPMGLVTRHAYDNWGNETSVTRNCTSSGTTPPSPFSSCTGSGTADHQTNVTTTATFDQATVAGKAGLATRTTSAVGYASDYAYDALGRLVTEAMPGDASIPALTRTMSYDEFGNVLALTESWTPIGGGGQVARTTTRVYSATNQLTSVTDPSGTVNSAVYDAAGNQTSTTENGVTTTHSYDGLGRATSDTTDSGTTTHEYDAAGRETVKGLPEGGITKSTYGYTGWVLSEITDPDGLALTTTHTYDKLGHELTVTDPEGATSTYTYDRAGRQITTTTAVGVSTNVYDRTNNTVTVKAPDGTVKGTLFDPLGRPTDSITNCTNSGTTPPAAGTACLGTGTHDVTTNLTTTTFYDAAGTTIAERDALGITERIIPNARALTGQQIANCTDSGLTPTSNPRACVGGGTHNATTNVVTTTTYDGTSSVVGTSVAVGTGAQATTTTAYDGAGRVQAVQDPAGTITRNIYDADGQVVTAIVNCTNSGTTVPATGWETCTGAGTQDGTFNLTTSYTYDAAGNKVSETAPNGRLTTLAYDYDNRLITRIENDVASPSLPTEDVTTSYYYDSAGRLAATVSPTSDGSSSTITRQVSDANGRVVRVIRNCTLAAPGDNPADCGGPNGTALGAQTFEANVVTDNEYDAAGNLIKVTAPDPSASLAGTGSVVTRYAYDAANRLCRVLEGSAVTDLAWASAGCSGSISGTATTNLSTRYSYDGAGNLVNQTDARGKVSLYGYDPEGHLTSTTDADGATVVWAYDALGQKIRQENRSDPTGTASVTWTYDGAGRVLTRTADGATTSYTYDANGNKLTASVNGQTITATYDRLNRVVSVDDDDADSTPDMTFTYSLTSPSWTDPTGTYLVTLDKFDRALSLDDPVNAATFTWSYGADGQVKTQGDPNGNSTAFGYDALGRERTRVTTAAGPVTRAQYAWTRNQAGQVLSEASTITGDPANNTRTYTYDSIGRLTGFSDGTPTTYGWQETPNRSSVQVGAGTPVTTAYSNANRPVSNSLGGVYTSDADGRLTARPDAAGSAYQQFEWDDLSRLTRVTGPTGTVIATYSYDALDRLRVVDYGGSNRIRFRYLGMTASAVQVINDSTGAVIRHIGNAWTGEHLEDWAPGGGALRVFGTNGHHDVTWTAGSTGSVTGTARYDPFGTATAVTGSMPDFRFQGSWADNTTKLSWAVTRWYAPAQGQFLSEDTLVGEPREPDSRHLYAYGEGDPVGKWDPDGRRGGSWSAHQTAVLQLAMLVRLSVWGVRKTTIITADGFLRLGLTRWVLPSGNRPDVARITFYPRGGMHTWIWEVKPWSTYGRNTGIGQLLDYLIEVAGLRTTRVHRGYWLIPFATPNRYHGNEWVFSWSGTGAFSGIRWYRTVRYDRVRVPKPVPVTAPAPEPVRVNVPQTVAEGVGIGVGVYLLYRGIRMLPSLLPPLWPTIPANVAIP
jgi:RHS repeat-associated protein